MCPSQGVSNGEDSTLEFQLRCRTGFQNASENALVLCKRFLSPTMPDTATHAALASVFSEIADGTNETDGAVTLNAGDLGLLRSLDKLSAQDASRSVHDGATIAAHAAHLRYGLSLMNQWASEGGNPFANARWDEAWKLREVDSPAWNEIRNGLRDEAHRWFNQLARARELSSLELRSIIASIAHFAYHLGAIRQIDKTTRGPKEVTIT